MKNIIAELVQVSKVFPNMQPENAVLKNVSFQAYEREMILLLGPSGSGKTTLLTLLAGMQPPSYGDVVLFGKKVQDYSISEMQSLRAKKIGFIFQSFHLIESLTALENVMLVLKFVGVEKDKARIRALNCLERFQVGHLRKSYPHTFSQGEKQRVAVARALANNASLIIADEPTGSLASKQGFDIINLLKDGVDRENLCVIVSSHDERIKKYANRIFSLNDGNLVGE